MRFLWLRKNDHSRRFSLLILGISFTLLSFVYWVSWYGRQKCKSRYQFRRFFCPVRSFYKMGGMRVWVSSFRAFCGVSGRDIYPGKRAKFSRALPLLLVAAFLVLLRLSGLHQPLGVVLHIGKLVILVLCAAVFVVNAVFSEMRASISPFQSGGCGYLPPFSISFSLRTAASQMI